MNRPPNDSDQKGEILVNPPVRPPLLESLAALHKQCFDEGWSPDSFKQLLANPHNHLIACFIEDDTLETNRALAEDGNAKSLKILCGFLHFSAVLDTAEIITLAVAPNHQRQGIGERLLTSTMAYCKAHRIEKILLEVAENNKPAISLYKSVHAKQLSKRTNYYKSELNTPIDAIIYQISLK